MKTANTVSPELKKQVYQRILSAPFFTGIIFFWPAGTLLYWEAWVYMIVLFTLMFSLIAYLLKNDPGLLERRMRHREKEMQQKQIVKVFTLYFAATFLLPGFDQRFGWSDVPVWVALAANAVVFLSYMLLSQVFRVNSYASRIVEVEEEQKVITTGPYAWVRHPMYTAILLMYAVTPLALGSYWAMLATIILPFILMARIQNEEEVLVRELKGYTEYQEKTRYRLIPGVW